MIPLFLLTSWLFFFFPTVTLLSFVSYTAIVRVPSGVLVWAQRDTGPGPFAHELDICVRCTYSLYLYQNTRAYKERERESSFITWHLLLMEQCVEAPPCHLQLIYTRMYIHYYLFLSLVPSASAAAAAFSSFYCYYFVLFLSLNFDFFLLSDDRERTSWKKPWRNQNATGRLLCALRAAISSSTHTHTHTGYIIIIAGNNNHTGQGAAGSNICYFFHSLLPFFF